MEYPRFQGDVDLDPEANWAEVEDVPMPELNNNEIAYEDIPVLKDSKWVKQWLVRSLTEEEVLHRKIADIKIKVISNIPLSQEEANLLVG